MKNKYLCLLLLPFILFTQSCGKRCNGKKITMGVMFANYNDSLSIEVDHKLMFSGILKDSSDEYGYFERYDLFDVCVESDSVLARVNFNKKDSVFYLLPRDIDQCYAGNNIADEISLWYDFAKGAQKVELHKSIYPH